MTQEELKSVLGYEPKLGVFTWLVSSARKRAGSRAGSLKKTGYRSIKICEIDYLEHRLAYLWMTGSWPDDKVDHKNLVKDDNRWDNLREASQMQNCHNVMARKHSKSGIKGVSRRGARWDSRIVVDRKRHYLGSFDTIEGASEAYRSAAIALLGEFARAA